MALGKLSAAEVIAGALEQQPSESTYGRGCRWSRTEHDAAGELDALPSAALAAVPVVKDIIDVARSPPSADRRCAGAGSPQAERATGRAPAADRRDSPRQDGHHRVRVLRPRPHQEPAQPRLHARWFLQRLRGRRRHRGRPAGSRQSAPAGSLTRPASYCGVAGFVAPARGPLDTTGFVGLAPGLDAVGLLTPTVADLRLAHGASIGAERVPGPPQPPTRPRLAVWSGDELAEISKDMRAALARSVEDAVANGAVLVDVDLPALTPRPAVEAHVTVMAYEAARTLAEESTHPDRLSAPLNELLAHGRSLTTEDYERARSVARRERSAMLALLCDVDAVLGPSAGCRPEGPDGHRVARPEPPRQLLGLPAVTVPGHRDAQGMPLGVQLVGHPDRLEGLFSLGHAVERAARANDERRPPGGC